MGLLFELFYGEDVVKKYSVLIKDYLVIVVDFVKVVKVGN